MNKRFIEIDGLTISAFETEPIKGYEAPTNKETGEQFPNCCFFHKSVFEISEKWLLKSSNYCNNKDVAVKIVKQLSYTQHHIKERKNIDDWYNDITDYIEYNIDSFGHPATGLHLYLDFLKQWIEHKQSKIPKIKKQSLIEFIENCLNPIDIDKIPMTDFNMLLDTYNKWFKIFPFEISFFATLKPHFENLRPIFNGKKHNPYSKTYTFKAHTKCSLIVYLLNLTNSVLMQINPYTLYEKGQLTEPQKIKLELILNEMKVDNKKGYTSQKQNEEQQYRDILKNWFDRQKKFIDEVTPLLKAVTPQQTLSELITHKNGVKIVEGIKIQYKNIKGKQLKLLLLALQELNLLPKERIAKKFHNCCKAEFDWEIATYQAMNDHQYNKRVDLEELDNMKQYIEKIIKA